MTFKLGLEEPHSEGRGSFPAKEKTTGKGTEMQEDEAGSLTAEFSVAEHGYFRDGTWGVEAIQQRYLDAMPKPLGCSLITAGGLQRC